MLRAPPKKKHIFQTWICNNLISDQTSNQRTIDKYYCEEANKSKENEEEAVEGKKTMKRHHENKTKKIKITHTVKCRQFVNLYRSWIFVCLGGCVCDIYTRNALEREKKSLPVKTYNLCCVHWEIHNAQTTQSIGHRVKPETHREIGRERRVWTIYWIREMNESHFRIDYETLIHILLSFPPSVREFFFFLLNIVFRIALVFFEVVNRAKYNIERERN